ncbi:putative cell survival pathways protein, partial [Tulasnella sp. 417]
MFSSFFSATDPNAPNLHPVTNGVAPADLFGELVPEDLEWVCAGGFSAETHIWYQRLEDGTFLMCQVIHSAVGLWYPTVQFTFRHYNPATKENIWRSANVSGFVSPATGSDDKRTGKSDKFTVLFKPATDTTEETYSITANPADDVQVSLEVSRVATVPGFKVGKGPKGGNTYFGADTASPEGYVFHKFWPMTTCKGTIVVNGKAISANGTGMFVHAIQGMRPNLVASRWNFAHFEGDDNKTSATMMEFTSTPGYGKKGDGSGGVVINVGCVVRDGKLAV